MHYYQIFMSESSFFSGRITFFSSAIRSDSPPTPQYITQKTSRQIVAPDQTLDP